MSMSVSYLRVAADHIKLLQKDPSDALDDLNLKADYPDENTAVGLILQNLPGDIEELNLNDTRWLAWLLWPAVFEDAPAPPALDLPLAAILGGPAPTEGRDAVRVPALDFGLGEGRAFDPATVQKLSKALSQIIPDDLLRNFDYDAMQGIGLPGFGVPGPYNEEERATEERLARESVGYELWQLQEFYRRAADSGQYVIVYWK